MRVTLGERLGIRPNTNLAKPVRAPSEHDGVPSEVEPELVRGIRIRGAPSSTLPFGHPVRRPDDGGPARVRGEMVWLHKTAPTLVIEGGSGISPEDHAAGRRR